jgi:hypothetical protein
MSSDGAPTSLALAVDWRGGATNATPSGNGNWSALRPGAEHRCRYDVRLLRRRHVHMHAVLRNHRLIAHRVGNSARSDDLSLYGVEHPGFARPEAQVTWQATKSSTSIRMPNCVAVGRCSPETPAARSGSSKPRRRSAAVQRDVPRARAWLARAKTLARQNGLTTVEADARERLRAFDE